MFKNFNFFTIFIRVIFLVLILAGFFIYFFRKDFRIISFSSVKAQSQGNGGCDVSISKFDIKTFSCFNEQPDTSYIDEFLTSNSSYEFKPSTTVANDYLRINQIEGKEILKCPESQRNRPIKVSAEASCSGQCGESRLRVQIIKENSNEIVYQEESSLNNSYPKNVEFDYILDQAYNYIVRAIIVDSTGYSSNLNSPKDNNPNNDSQEKILAVYDYYCQQGFCVQSQRDDNIPPFYRRIVNFLTKTDVPCIFWKNEVCKARFGF